MLKTTNTQPQTATQSQQNTPQKHTQSQTHMQPQTPLFSHKNTRTATNTHTAMYTDTATKKEIVVIYKKFFLHLSSTLCFNADKTIKLDKHKLRKKGAL